MSEVWPGCSFTSSCHDMQTDNAQGAPAHKCPVELAEVALSTTVPPCISPYPQSRQGWAPHSGLSVLCSVQHYTLFRAHILPPSQNAECCLILPLTALCARARVLMATGMKFTDKLMPQKFWTLAVRQSSHFRIPTLGRLTGDDQFVPGVVPRRRSCTLSH